MTDNDVLPDFLAVVLMALIRVHARDSRATFRSVAAEADRSLSVTYRSLSMLRARGLCDWGTDQQGTLRPTVAAFPLPETVAS